MSEISEELRQALRRWTTGVAVVTSRSEDFQHGMTVNSLSSVSLDPPYVVVTLDRKTRTYGLVENTGIFGVTILRDEQKEIADRFSGKVLELQDRFSGIETFTLVTGAPLLADGLAHLDCRVAHKFEMVNSTSFFGEVLATRRSDDMSPLVYFNRTYHKLEP